MGCSWRPVRPSSGWSPPAVVTTATCLTEYVVTLDAEAASELPGFSAGGLSANELPFDELTYSMWVDEDVLLRKITSDLGGFGSLEGRFFDYGEPVEIEAPPADEVADLAAIMQGAGGTQDEDQAGGDTGD